MRFGIAAASIRHTTFSGGPSYSTDATVVSDFKAGAYLVSGATAAVTDIWEQDLSYGTWDPATDITAGVGMGGVESWAKVKSAARAIIDPSQTGCVVCITAVIPSGTSGQVQFTYGEEALFGMGNVGYVAFHKNTTLGSTPSALADWFDGSSTLDTGTHKIAIKMTPTSAEVLADTAYSNSASDGTPATPDYIALSQYVSGVIIVERIMFFPESYSLADALTNG